MKTPAIAGLAGCNSPALQARYKRALPHMEKAARNSFPRTFTARELNSLGAVRLGKTLSSAVSLPARLYLERPGKMLRPFIALTLLEAYGKDPGKYAAVSGAIELMEAATVSFDDIIDGSDVRRGGRATHKIYGIRSAYLAYQAAYNRAYRVFLSPRLKLEDWRREEILATLSREIFAYGYGQASELYWTSSGKRPAPGQYLDMTWDRIRFLSFNGPFRIGALLGGCRSEDLPRFASAGSWLGMAYHLHGDELNLFPRSADWGKPLADDISGGRYTFLYLTALRLTGGRRRMELLRALGNRRISGDALKNVIDIVRSSGAVAENRRMAGIFYGRAARAIDALPIPERYRRTLLDLARYMAYDRKK